MNNLNLLPAMVQGGTEALPIASSLHLKLIGASNVDALHAVTGATVLIYSLVYQRATLMQILRAILPFPIRFLIASAVLFCMVAIIPCLKIALWNLVHLVLLVKSMPNWGIAIAVTVSATLMIISERSKPSRTVKDFCNMDFILCIFANLIGAIPGASRLGTVYTLLRFRQFAPKDALLLAFVQGISTFKMDIKIDIMLREILSILTPVRLAGGFLVLTIYIVILVPCVKYLMRFLCLSVDRPHVQFRKTKLSVKQILALFVCMYVIGCLVLRPIFAILKYTANNTEIFSLQNIVCGILNLFVTFIVLHLSPVNTARFICACGLYRYFLAIYLLVGNMKNV